MVYLYTFAIINAPINEMLINDSGGFRFRIGFRPIVKF